MRVFEMTEELRDQYHRCVLSLTRDCIVYKKNGDRIPLAFLSSTAEEISVSVGRGLDVQVDVEVPCKSGWCGLS